MAHGILADTCYWIGLLDPKDQFHSVSSSLESLTEGYTVLFPWPCLYETLSTYLTRRRDLIILLEKTLSKPEIVMIDDREYKSQALAAVFSNNRKNGFTWSLADSVLREILKDNNINVKILFTYNSGDFYDVCAKRGIEIVDENFA